MKTLSLLRFTVAALLAALAGACGADSPGSGPVTTQTLSAIAGIEIAHLDRTVRPQDDLYQYANGFWLSGLEMPADRPSYGVFNRVTEAVANDVQAILIQILLKKPETLSADERRVKDFYLSFMDEAGVEARGASPLIRHLEKIRAVSTPKELAQLFAYFTGRQLAHPFRLFVEEHPHRSPLLVFHIEQAGLGMPGRTFYFEEGAHAAEIRIAYRNYIETLFRLAGEATPAAMADAVYALELRLAAIQWPLEKTRDQERARRPYPYGQIKAMMPHLGWDAYFAALGVDPGDEIVVRQDSYFQHLDALLYETDLPTWRAYFTFHLLNELAPFLPKAFVDTRFDFYQRAVRDTELPTLRERDIFNYLRAMFPGVLGRAYVERHFDRTTEAVVRDMVERLRQAFLSRLDSNPWMSPQTKARAREKLERLTFRVGFPQTWENYEGYETSAADLMGNVLRYQQFDFFRQAGRAGKARDPKVWQVSPLVSNAYYFPPSNEIVLPAALLRPPLFDPEAGVAARYGSLGAVIGHEIIHAFDDQGRKFDGSGNLTDWWEEGDEARFERETSKLAAFYSAFTPLPGLSINGAATLGENIGDLGGLALAHEAYRLSLEGRMEDPLVGFTGEQRLFLAWAQLWAQKAQEAELRRQLLAAVHAPSRFRVNGAVAQLPEFYLAFGVSEGDALYIPGAQRVHIW